MTNDITMNVVAGLDIGNGYVKGQVGIDGHEPMSVDLPSTVSYTTGVDIPREPTDGYIDNLGNQMDATITSPCVKSFDAGRVFFGRRAVLSGTSSRQFNIDDHTPKCKDPLSTMLTLGALSSAAVRDYWREHKALPGRLHLNVTLGMALPIGDYIDWHETYRTMLMRDNHQVVIHNFEHAIEVSVRFVNVVVLAEGAAAQYAITELGPKFLQLALDMARADGLDVDKAYTGEMLASARNTIGIDIGEGTVNFPVFVDGNISIESSSSINKGYGTVLTNVVAKLRNTPMAFESRKALADFLLDKDLLPAQAATQAAVRHYVEEEVQVFVRDVMAQFANVFRKVGIRTDVIYVYGGGAASVRDALLPKLEEGATLGQGTSLPVIYLDSSYSRDLNRRGLWQVASMAAGKGGNK